MHYRRAVISGVRIFLYKQLQYIILIKQALLYLYLYLAIIYLIIFEKNPVNIHANWKMLQQGRPTYFAKGPHAVYERLC